MSETLVPQHNIEIKKHEVGGKLELKMPIIPEGGIVVIGDIHLFAYKIGPFTIRIDGRRAIQYLRNIPERLQPDIFVLNGDAFDLSSQPDIQFSIKYCSAFFEYLRETGKKVVYLSGNHDKVGVLQVLREKFGDFIEFGDWFVIGEDKAKVQHGHRVVMAPVGIDLKEKLNEEGEKQKKKNILKRTLFGVFSRIPLEGPLAIIGNNVVGGWINRWRFIPKNLKAKVITTDTGMRKFAQEEEKVKLHIMGHTHTVAQGDNFINPGSFLRIPFVRDRFVAVHIDVHGGVRLIDCVMGKETTVEEIYASRIASLMHVVGRIIERKKVIA